ncbi:MAG: ABC transporter ATP-binding protein [Truepera sp.]|nr:ABC transporter ATP-binding protein [Truepera sp.]
MLRAHQLSKIYRDAAGDITALSDFSHTFETGQMTAIMGPSGSGKSTLLNVLAGLDTPTSGEVWLSEVNLAMLPEQQRAELRLHKFGFVFQSYNLIAVLNAQQNVAFPMGLAGLKPSERNERALALLQRFGLGPRAGHAPHKLSGGERQRVAIARALANNPDVVFADEPTGNLDSKSGLRVAELLKEVAYEGRSVVVVTHDHRLAKHADVVLQLEDGRLSNAMRPNADMALA